MTDRFYSLQYLRALAAWMVVFHHYVQVFRDFRPEGGVEKLFAYYGNLGVDIFFVLSGFIMAFSMTRRENTAGRFMWDRITRIVPAYWLATVVLLIVLAGFSWDGIAYLQGTSWRDLLYSFLFIPHQHVSGLGVFPVLTVGWTLNFEMFFYLLLAIGLLINNRRAVIITVFLVFALPLFSRYVFHLGAIPASFLLYEFAFGLLIYLVGVQVLRMTERGGVLRYTLATLCAVAALVSMKFRFDGYDMIVSVALVLGFVLVEDFFAMLSRSIGRFIVHLGDLSYSTYLFHVPVLVAVGAKMDISRANDLWLVLAVCTLTYAASLCSFIFVEKRFRTWLANTMTPRGKLTAKPQHQN